MDGACRNDSSTSGESDIVFSVGKDRLSGDKLITYNVSEMLSKLTYSE